MMALHQPGGLELSQYPVDRRQTNLLAVVQKGFIDILGGEMALGRGAFFPTSPGS